MRMSVNAVVTSRIPAFRKDVEQACSDTIKEIVILIANESKKNSPVAPVNGGTNRRSITPLTPGHSKDGIKAGPFGGAVYSTSGYGGYLETGTRWNLFTRKPMPARPYMYPAMKRHFSQAKVAAGIRRRSRFIA